MQAHLRARRLEVRDSLWSALVAITAVVIIAGGCVTSNPPPASAGAQEKPAMMAAPAVQTPAVTASPAEEKPAVTASPAEKTPAATASPSEEPLPATAKLPPGLEPKDDPKYMDFFSSVEEVDRIAAPYWTEKKKLTDLPRALAAARGIVADSLSHTPQPPVFDTSRPPVKIIYDTDIGTDVDDAFALAFALRRKEIQVLAITTARGLHPEQRAAIVSRLLQVMGRTDIPFTAGPPTLADGTPSPDKKPVNEFPFAGAEDDRPKPFAGDAQELFKQVIEKNPGEVWLVLEGPFTNAAILIRDHPEVANKLKGIVCMGGDLSRPQNETNIDNDRTAAPIVYASGLLKFDGTDDITGRILVTKPDLINFWNADTPASRMLYELVTKYWKPLNAYGKPGPILCDLSPVVWLIRPDLYTTIQTGIEVKGAKTFPSATAPACAATTDVDAVAVHRLMIDTLTAK